LPVSYRNQAMSKDYHKAAVDLFEAMKGFGYNGKKMVDTLAPLDPADVQKVKEEFHKEYKKDLAKELKGETSGNFERALLAFLQDPVEYDAWLLYDAIEGLGTNDIQLIEVLVARHPDHLKKVVEFFQKQYGKSVEEWISGDTSGDYRDYLLVLATANRESNSLPVTQEKVKEDAAALYRAGEAKSGTDENVFIDVFAKKSWKHLRQVAEHYAKQYSHSLHTAIDKEFSGDLGKALKWTLEFVENRQSFFAKRIHDSMKGIGTSDKHLIRIIISRRHVDLYEIAEEYTKIFGKSLKEALHAELSGDYRLFMERIVVESE